MGFSTVSWEDSDKQDSNEMKYYTLEHIYAAVQQRKCRKLLADRAQPDLKRARLAECWRRLNLDSEGMLSNIGRRQQPARLARYIAASAA
jgi:hypothetical protein